MQIDHTRDAIIEASAGTGKTYTLERIVCDLVCEKGYAPPQILLVTYTEKAAGELRDRIRRSLAKAGKLGSDFSEMAICTIHSFCKKILDEYAFESGAPMSIEIYTDEKSLERRARLAAASSQDFEKTFAPRLLALDPADAHALETQLEILENEDVDFAALVRRHVEEMKAASGIATYDDLVIKAEEAIAGGGWASGRLCEALRRRYRIALVDEFQDTDERQWKIFSTLFSAKNNKIEGLPPGSLVVVGDPKQAIYSFRGADVAIYCAARDEITGGPQAACPPNRHTLGATYRSTRRLVDALNKIFSGGWFADGAAGGGIDYTPVTCPENNPKFDSLAARGEIEPVMLLEAAPENLQPAGSARAKPHFGNTAQCLPQLAESIAAEILRLVDSPEADGARFSSMCVLTGNNREARIVRDALARRAIPYSQYKQRGIFASAEAQGVLALLDFIARPSSRGRRNALLVSALFDIPPARIGALDAAFEDAFSSLCSRLCALEEASRWGEFFELAMQSPCTALADLRKETCAFNRTRAAVRQIFDALLGIAATRRAIGAGELADELAKLRDNDSQAGENASLFEKESAADCVQIMTIHASKGLQFPFVFLATGAGAPKKDGAEERRRLLYVALTRAERRIYLPWSRRAWSWECAAPTKASPDRTLCSRGIGSAGADLADGGVLANAIISLAPPFAPQNAQTHAPAPAQTAAPAAADFYGTSAPDGTRLEKLEGIRARRLFWDSFTSLCAGQPAHDAPDDPAETDETADAAAQTRLAPLPPTLLPRTNISGTVFHEIMRALCGNDEALGQTGFSNAADPAQEKPLLALIKRMMRRFGLANKEDGSGTSTAETLRRIIVKTLATPLDFAGERFRLSEIPRCDRLAELDFVLAEDAIDFAPVNGRGGLLNGQIDLVARRGARVFIFDWKTNSLETYDAASVAGAMARARYPLQGAIYSKAVEAWLDGRALSLAGCAYIFVRAAENGPSAVAHYL